MDGLLLDLLPGFFLLTTFLIEICLASLRASIPFTAHRYFSRRTHAWRCCMDFVYLTVISLFFLVTVGLAAGCAKLRGTS